MVSAAFWSSLQRQPAEFAFLALDQFCECLHAAFIASRGQLSARGGAAVSSPLVVAALIDTLWLSLLALLPLKVTDCPLVLLALLPSSPSSPPTAEARPLLACSCALALWLNADRHCAGKLLLRWSEHHGVCYCETGLRESLDQTGFTLSGCPDLR